MPGGYVVVLLENTIKFSKQHVNRDPTPNEVLEDVLNTPHRHQQRVRQELRDRHSADTSHSPRRRHTVNRPNESLDALSTAQLQQQQARQQLRENQNVLQSPRRRRPGNNAGDRPAVAPTHDDPFTVARGATNVSFFSCLRHFLIIISLHISFSDTGR